MNAQRKWKLTSIVLFSMVFLQFIYCSKRNYKNPADPEVEIQSPSALLIDAETDKSVYLSWHFEGKAHCFRIERGAEVEDFILIAFVDIEERSYIDTTGISAGINYTYRISAIADDNASSFAKQTIQITFPSPSDLKIMQISQSEIQLTWADNSSFEEGFLIERKGVTGNFQVVGQTSTNATIFIDSSLPSPQEGLSFTYRLSAFTSVNTSISVTASIHATPPFSLVNTYSGHSRNVQSLSFSLDRDFLASAGWDWNIIIWGVEEWISPIFLRGPSMELLDVSFSPNGQYISACGYGSNTFRVWRIEEWSDPIELTGHTSLSPRVNSVSFSHDSRYLASAGYDNTIRIWQVGDWNLLATLTGHTGSVESVAFSVDDRFLASASADSTIRIWNTDMWDHQTTLTGHTGRISSITFSPNNDYLASGSWDTTVRIWQLDTWSNIQLLTEHTNWVWSVCFSPDDEYLASSGDDRIIRIWRVGSWDSIATLTGHTGGIRTVAISPNVRYLASGSWDTTIRIWSGNPEWHWQ